MGQKLVIVESPAKAKIASVARDSKIISLGNFKNSREEGCIINFPLERRVLPAVV